MVSEPMTSSTGASRARRVLPPVQMAVRMANAIGARLKLTDHYVFDDRVTGAPTVACLIAGQKSELWTHILPRLRMIAGDVDICIATPGRMKSELREICAEFGWSYLGTATRDASLTQNICYRLHPDATTIVKLDDDILLLPDTIENLVNELQALKEVSNSPPSFLAPVMPLDVSCYRWVLQRLGHLEEFQRRFGQAGGSDADIAVLENLEAARWIWRATGPLSHTAERLSAHGRKLLSCDLPPRVGVIAFERSFWEETGYLPVNRGRLVVGLSTQGSDDSHIMTQAKVRSRPGYFTSSAIAGRFAHAHQYQGMLEFVQNQPHLFER